MPSQPHHVPRPRCPGGPSERRCGSGPVGGPTGLLTCLLTCLLTGLLTCLLTVLLTLGEVLTTPSLAFASPVPSGTPIEGARGLSAPPAGAVEAPGARLDPPAALAPRPRGPRSPLELSLLAGTTAPVDLALTVRARIVRHLLVDASVGLGVYGGLFAAVARGRGASSPAGAALAGIVDGAFSVHGSLGVRPFRHRGFELVAGLGRVHGASSLTGEAASDVAGVQLPYDAFDASITLRTATIELACSAGLGRRFVLRPAIGVLFLREARVDISASASAVEDTRAEVRDAIRQVEAVVRHDIEAAAPVPTVSIALGVRLGPLAD